MGAGAFAVAAAATLLGQPAQVLHLGERAAGAGGRRGIRRARERGQAGGHQAQVERRRPAHLGGALHHARVAQEAAGLLRPTAQVGTGGGGQPRVQFLQAAPGAHGGHRGGQAALGRGGVVDVVAGDHAHVVAGGQFGEGVVADGVQRVAVVPQLHQHAVPPERADQPLQLAAGRAGAVGHQRGGHGTLAAAGEHPPVAGHLVGHVGEAELRRPLLPRQVAEAQRAGETGVAVGPVGQHQQVAAVRVGSVAVGHHPGVHLALGVGLAAGPAALGGEADLRPEHGGQADGAGGLGEADDPVQPVVIGERQGLQPQAVGFLHQRLGMAGPVEEGEVAVAVQLGVGRAALPRRVFRDRGLVGLALAPPGRPVAAGVPRRTTRLAPVLPPGPRSARERAAGEDGLHLLPRPVRVVERHRGS